MACAIYPVIRQGRVWYVIKDLRISAMLEITTINRNSVNHVTFYACCGDGTSDTA